MSEELSSTDILALAESASRWNSALLRERVERMPYFDAQTGVAQSDSRLFHASWERYCGLLPDQVYAYPTRRWIRRPAPIPPPPPSSFHYDMMAVMSATDGVNLPIGDDRQSIASGSFIKSSDLKYGAADWNQSEIDQLFDDERDDAEQLEDEDDEYYDESYKKKRRKQNAGVSPASAKRLGARRLVTEEDALKPYVCETCGLGYKTKPGLHYHLVKSHCNDPPATVLPAGSVPTPGNRSRQGGVPPPRGRICEVCRLDMPPTPRRQSGLSDDLVHCSDCGKAGHPVCLQLTPNMLTSVQKYGWQCIDCKTCSICGTSENDDQLLFCDDCDKAMHLYCLEPPLSEPPEGSWSCKNCVIEFHGGQDPNPITAGMAAGNTTAAAVPPPPTAIAIEDAAHVEESQVKEEKQEKDASASSNADAIKPPSDQIADVESSAPAQV